MGNARAHNLGSAQRCIEAARAKCPAHPAYSVDLAPSDFFPFGHIIGKRPDYSHESREDILNMITEIATGVDQEVLPGVFESWVNWFNWVIKREGKYCSK
jgi:hypothetical protein